MWIKNSNNYRIVPDGDINNKLDKGVYVLNFSQDSGFFLTKKSDKLDLPKKLYNFNQVYLDHVYKAYEKGNRQMGVLLSGLKGTGKTIFAKILAEKTNLPIVIINQFYGSGMIQYMASINQPVVFFYDEFEKVFKAGGEDVTSVLLPLLDGVFTSEKHLHLLTVNSLSVNENFLSRPGRIRYNIKFSSLKEEHIKEIIEDKLEDKSLFNDTIKVLSEFEDLTIDSVISFIEDINLLNSMEISKEILNIDKAKIQYNVVFKIKGKSYEVKSYYIEKVRINEEAQILDFNYGDLVFSYISKENKGNKTIFKKCKYRGGWLGELLHHNYSVNKEELIELRDYVESKQNLIDITLERVERKLNLLF